MGEQDSGPGRGVRVTHQVGTPADQRRLPDRGVSPEDVARWNEFGPRYGLRIVGPPIPPGS